MKKIQGKNMTIDVAYNILKNSVIKVEGTRKGVPHAERAKKETVRLEFIAAFSYFNSKRMETRCRTSSIFNSMQSKGKKTQQNNCQGNIYRKDRMKPRHVGEKIKDTEMSS